MGRCLHKSLLKIWAGTAQGAENITLSARVHGPQQILF